MRLRTPTERRRRPLFDFLADSGRRPGVLVVLDPPLDLEGAELAQVRDFVLRGGSVVAAGWGGGITPCVRWRLRYRYAFPPSASLPVAAPRPGLALPAVTNYLQLPTPEE